jgi:hypothetical protein
MDRHHATASSPTQPTFNPPPPTLQPSFNSSISSANPSQPALPSISASLFSREPVTKYYDPTQDAGDAGVNRRPRYEPYTSDVSCLINKISFAINILLKVAFTGTRNTSLYRGPRYGTTTTCEL